MHRSKNARPSFNPKPYQVIDIKGDTVTARNAEHTVTRNVSFFKYLPNYQKPEEEEQNDDEEDYDGGVAGTQQPEMVDENQRDPPEMQPRYHFRQNRKPPDYYRS